MASLVDSEKIGSSNKLQMFDHDPGATTAVLTSADGGTTINYWDMRDLINFGVLAKPSIVGGGGMTKLEIVASVDTAFTTVVVIKDSGVVAADALNDNVFLECTDAEIVQLGDTLRYVAARLTNATGTDEVAVLYIGWPKRKYHDLTPPTAIA